METPKQNSREYFRIMDVLFYALLAGQVMFAVIVLVFNLTGIVANTIENQITNVLILVVVFILAASIYASQIIFRNKMKAVDAMSSLSDKMAEYRAASVIRWALLEFPSFLAIMAAFYSGNLIFVGIALIVMIYFLTIKPGAEKAANELNLDMNEKMKLFDPETMI